MIPLALAIELKEAGLIWRTATHDFFAIPDHGLDDRVFVLADMVAFTELIQGWPAVAFHGAAEWALDYIYSDEIVWMPTEEQLREALVHLWPGGNIHLRLELSEPGYLCRIASNENEMVFEGPSATEAYARAVLYALRHPDSTNRV